jgi:hypothetical protein
MRQVISDNAVNEMKIPRKQQAKNKKKIEMH